MAAPTGPFFDAYCRAPRRVPRSGNMWDDCILLSDQAGFTWGTGQFVANSAANDAAKAANNAAMTAGIAAALAANKPLYIGRQGAKGWFVTSTAHIASQGVEVRADNMRRSLWIAEPLTGATAGEKATPTCNLRLRGGNRLWNFTRMMPGATVRGSTPFQHAICSVEDGLDCDDISIDGVQSVGGGASGFFFLRGKRIRTSGTEVSRSLADGFHVDYLVDDVNTSNHKAISCGDDAWANVSLQNVKNNENLFVSYLHVVRGINAGGRGLCFAGGENQHARHVYTKNTPAWGVVVISDLGFFTHEVRNFSVQDAWVWGTGATYSLFNIGGKTGNNALNGRANTVENGFFLRCGGSNAGAAGNGITIQSYVKDVYFDLDCRRCNRGIQLGSSWNNIEIVGRFAEMNRGLIFCTSGAFAGTEASMHGGYLLLHDITVDSLAFGTVDSMFKLTCTGFAVTSPQFAALDRFEIYNITQSYTPKDGTAVVVPSFGFHPTTGAALTAANFGNVRFEGYNASGFPVTVRLANFTSPAGWNSGDDFAFAWTVVTS